MKQIALVKRLWKGKSMYRAGLLRAVVEEISKYKLDLVGVQEVKWGTGGTESAGEYTFFYGEGNEQVFSYIRQSYQQLRG
jgi:hypothetical protein